MYVDAHCHLERETYGDELERVIERAFAAGLTDMVAVGASRVADGAREAAELADRYERIWCTAGIHPHEAAQATDADVAAIESRLAHPKCVALGEVGLDFYYDNSPRAAQEALFRRFLLMARAHEAVVMLHVRDAHEVAWRLLDEIGLPSRGGVVHCFTGGPREAAEYLARGMTLSIPGIVTFKSAEALRQAVVDSPLDRLLIETDSPYLAPIPHRGRRNEPAYVVATAAAVGALKGRSGEEIGRITRDNAMRLFGWKP